MCHYTSPFAVITRLIRPQVCLQMQTLKETLAHTLNWSKVRCCADRLPSVTWARDAGLRAKGPEGEVRAGRGGSTDNEKERGTVEAREAGINEES